MHGYDFRCVVTGDCGDETSASAAMFAVQNVPPTISISVNPAGPSCNPPDGVPVTWINEVNVSTNGNSITKTGSNSDWDASANSMETILSAGYISSVIDSTNTARMFGLKSIWKKV